MKTFKLLLFAFILSPLLMAQDLELELIAQGFNSPLDIKNAGDDRLFIVERGGNIKILNSDGTINATPFLNISSIITSGNERGLLGLAFHPDYANNGYFYVNYTDLNGDTRISRFTVSADPDVADPNSILVMLTENQPFSNHNGGHLAFGPDGMLYIGMGDGGSGGDPQNNSQTFTNLLGKMLRLNVDIPAPYIPADNPFVGSPDIPQEIWAYGLRNPWRFSFDSETGDLWIADVGQNAWEEINRQPSTEAALNYGWRCYEGNAPYNTNGCPPQSDMTFPIAVLSHSGGHCSITGGYVYRGLEFPAIQGLYFFTDYCSNQIGTVDADGDITLHGTLGASAITSFGVDHNNELYLAAFTGGRIYKIKDNTPISVEENHIDTFTLYPNPAQDFINIHLSIDHLSKVELFDITGKLVASETINQLPEVSLNISSLKSGIYIVAVSDSKENKSFKKLVIN